MTAILVLGSAGVLYCTAYLIYCVGRGPARAAVGAAVLCLAAAAAVIALAVS